MTDTDNHNQKKKSYHDRPDDTYSHNRHRSPDPSQPADQLTIHLPVVVPDNVLSTQPGSPPVICIPEAEDSDLTADTIQLVASLPNPESTSC